MDKTFDAIVIGGGSAGLAFAREAASHGASVALIEKDALGGTCVNRGCVPKKLIWEAGHLALQSRRMADKGVVSPERLDFSKLKKRVDAKIADLRDTFRRDLQTDGVTVVQDVARVDRPDRVTVGDRTFGAERLILATGARPDRLQIAGAANADTSDDVLAWEEVPERIIVLGGGYIGCELGAIMAAFGAAVLIVEPGSRVLDAFDHSLADHAKASLERMGIEVLLETSPEEIVEHGDQLELRLSTGAARRADRIIDATGRAAAVAGIGPLSDRLERAQSGALAVSDRFETSLNDVFAIGDVADRLPLTPVATRDGTTLANHLFGAGGTAIDLNLVATTAFLYPPHAQVGDASGGKPRSSDPLLTEVLAPSSDVEGQNFFKIGGDENLITGVALAADGAAEVIGVFAALLAAGANGEALAHATGVHPTMIEEMLGRD